MSFEEGALCEPLSVALQAAQRTGMSQHDTVIIIFGAGTVGLLIGAVAKSMGLRVTILGSLR
jgi:L-iditol 2-dehydrogenase